MAQMPLVRQDLLRVEALRSHLDTSHSVGLLWTSDEPVAENSDSTQHSQEADIHAPCGIRNRSPRRRAAADPHLRRAANGVGAHLSVRWIPSFICLNCNWGECCGEFGFTWHWKEAVFAVGRRKNSCYRDTNKLCSTFRFILCKFEVIRNNVHGKNGLRHVDVEIIDVGEICKASVSVYFVYEGLSSSHRLSC
jgi:hypothetical protein